VKPRRTREHSTSNAEMSAQTKAGILNAAIACLAELGYAGTTISEIADRVGLTRAALIYHFESKHALMAAVIDAIYDEMAARFAAAAPPFLAPRERLLALLDSAGNHASSVNQIALLELLLAARRDPGFQAEVLPAIAQREAAFDGAWREAIGGLPNAPRLEMLRDLSVAVLRGVTIGRSLGHDVVRIDHQLAELRRLFVEAITP